MRWTAENGSSRDTFHKNERMLSEREKVNANIGEHLSENLQIHSASSIFAAIFFLLMSIVAILRFVSTIPFSYRTIHSYLRRFD